MNPYPHRVLHIIHSLAIGGAEKSLSSLVGSKHGDGTVNKVLVLKWIPKERKEVAIDEANVLRLGRDGAPILLRDLRELKAQIRSFDPHIIQGWMYQGSLISFFLWAFFFRYAGLIWNIRHGLDDYASEPKLRKLLIFLLAKISHFPSAIVFNNCKTLSQHRAVGVAVEKALVISNGANIDADLLTAPAEVNFIPPVYGGFTIIGTVARFHADKGYDLFFEVAALTLEAKPKTLFVVVGRDIDARASFFRERVPAHLRERVIFCGELKNPTEVVRHFDIYLLTSRREGFPNSLVEALALEVPCVSVDVGDAKQILNGIGVIAETRAPKTVFAALDRMLSLDKSELEDMGRRSREKIALHYSLEKMVRSYNQLYQGVHKMPR